MSLAYTVDIDFYLQLATHIQKQFNDSICIVDTSMTKLLLWFIVAMMMIWKLCWSWFDYFECTMMYCDIEYHVLNCSWFLEVTLSYLNCWYICHNLVDVWNRNYDRIIWQFLMMLRFFGLLMHLTDYSRWCWDELNCWYWCTWCNDFFAMMIFCDLPMHMKYYCDCPFLDRLIDCTIHAYIETMRLVSILSIVHWFCIFWCSQLDSLVCSFIPPDTSYIL